MSGPVGSSTWFGTPGYDLDQSLRFNQPHDTTLSKTFASAGNRKTWTFSAWVKIGNPAAEGGNQLGIFGTYTNNSDTANIQFDGTGELHFEDYSGSYDGGLQVTEAKQRDPSAWYHIMVVYDTTQGTAANRIKLYVNSSLLTTKTGGAHTLPDQNHDGKFNNTAEHKIGMVNGTYCWDGHMAEVHFIDGTALGPESFGTTGVHGEWTPKEFAGAHGTNGFYLPFKNDYTVEGFSAVTYRGNNVAGLYIGGVGFQPDFVWTKKRNGSNSHRLVDAVRGATKTLMSDNSDAQGTENTVTSFETDGFTVGAGNSNNDAGTYVAWNWDMGGSNATLTAGSINSVVRANPTYGQSIVSYTGNAASSATIAHGLSSAPEMIIVRQVGANAWAVYHTSIGATHLVELNTVAAKADSAEFWADTSPTSSVFTIGGHAEVNPDGVAVIAYAFHSVTGYSKFASYTGNGSTTGPSVTLGFAPAFLLIKSATQGEPWSLIDNMRTHPTTGLENVFSANTAAAETQYAVDLNSNGFQIKTTSGVLNANSQTYIYMAFADKREYAYWLDDSGNNNDWTSNNLTESDISLDTPTITFVLGILYFVDGM